MTDKELMIQDLRNDVVKLKLELEKIEKMLRISRQKGWRSVEDGLPHFNGEYIVCCDDTNEGRNAQIWCESGIVVVAEFYNGSWEWRDTTTERYSLDSMVTHWMPMPNPPIGV